MTTPDEQPRTARAVAQLRAALEDPAVAAHFDEDTMSILAADPAMLVGSFSSDVQAVIDAAESIPASVTRLTRQADNLANNALNAATNAASQAVTATLGDLRQTVDFVRHGSDFVFGGPLHMLGKTSQSLAAGMFAATEAELEEKLGAMAKEIVARIPFVDLVEFMFRTASDYEKRAGYVLRSLVALEAAAAGNVRLDELPKKTVSLQSAETLVLHLLRFIWQHSLPGVLVSLVEEPSLANLLSKVIPLPPDLPLDFLHVWLTEKGLDQEELEFRKQLVACIDQFVREQQSVDVHLALPTRSSAKTGLNLLSELLTVIFSMVGSFTFRHPHVPSLALPKLHWTAPKIAAARPFDAAHVVSTGVSRTVSYSIKGLVATIGRGAWEINAHNDALIESVASAVSSFIGTLIQSVLNDLFWSVTIREIYEHQKKDVLLSWDAVVEDPEVRLFWGVSLRSKLLPQETEDALAKEISELAGAYVEAGQAVSEITKVLQSYTAYLDAIRDYTEVGAAADDETIRFQKRAGAQATVRYTCAADPAREPVIRAYCAGQVAVMQAEAAGQAPHRVYRCSFAENPPEDAKIFFRSNWGATAVSPDKPAVT